MEDAASTPSPETNLHRNAALVAIRILGWSPVLLDGIEYPFSIENAERLISDQSMTADLYQQINRFLQDMP
jgi:hypothetical protein